MSKRLNNLNKILKHNTHFSFMVTFALRKEFFGWRIRAYLPINKEPFSLQHLLDNTYLEQKELQNPNCLVYANRELPVLRQLTLQEMLGAFQLGITNEARLVAWHTAKKAFYLTSFIMLASSIATQNPYVATFLSGVAFLSNIYLQRKDTRNLATRIGELASVSPDFMEITAKEVQYGLYRTM